MTRTSPFAAVCLVVLLHASGSAPAQAGITAEESDNLKAAGERMRQTGEQVQKDIQERLQRLRKERAELAARQATERSQETERAQQQADRDKAALAATKETRQREALAATQEKERKAAAARAAEAERVRQAELKEKVEQEAALERAQQESLDTYKAGTKQRKLGSDAQFGVDL